MAETFLGAVCSDPFLILVAEMLLRKTAARQVAWVFPPIRERFGTAQLMVDADPHALRHLLRPLGFAAHRTRSLQGMAAHLLAYYGGQVPAEPRAVERISGVDPYTANAVGCFFLGLPLPIVDTNVIRVLDRFTGVETRTKRPHLQKSIWRRATRSLPEREVPVYNLGLLDLAALVCRPMNPQCGRCPLQAGCAAGRAALKTPRSLS